MNRFLVMCSDCGAVVPIRNDPDIGKRYRIFVKVTGGSECAIDAVSQQLNQTYPGRRFRYFQAIAVTHKITKRGLIRQ